MAPSEDVTADLFPHGCPVADIGALGQVVRDAAMQFDEGVRGLPHGTFRMELESWISWLHGHIRELRQLLEEAEADAVKASAARDSPCIVQEVTGAWCADEEDETAREVAELRRVRRELRSIFGMLDGHAGTCTLQVDDLGEDAAAEALSPLLEPEFPAEQLTNNTDLSSEPLHLPQDQKSPVEQQTNMACHSGVAELDISNVPNQLIGPSSEDLRKQEERRKARREKKEQRRQQRHSEASTSVNAIPEEGDCVVQSAAGVSNGRSGNALLNWSDDPMVVPPTPHGQRELCGGFIHSNPVVPLPGRLRPCSAEQQLWEMPRLRASSWTRSKDIVSRARERAEEVQRLERRDHHPWQRQHHQQHHQQQQQQQQKHLQEMDCHIGILGGVPRNGVYS